MGFSIKNSKGVTYYLNTKEVELRGGRMSNIFYFSKDERSTACELPEGKRVAENANSGLPVVKNKK